MTHHQRMSAPGVTSFGWDLVSSIRIGALNGAIASGGRCPAAFDGPADRDTRVSASFAPWRISSESDGDLMCMTLPLLDIAIATAGTAKSFAAGQAEIDLRLTYLPHDAPQRTGAGGRARKMLLVVDTGSADALAPVSVTNVELEGPHSFDDIIRVQAALELWLRENLAVFSHVLAAVSLYESVDKSGDFVWLKPTYLAYAFGRDATDPEQSILSVLSQTGARPADDLPRQTVADAIPPGLEAGFLVSRGRFLRDVILPALPAAFPGLTVADMKVLPDDAGLALMHKVQLHDIEYDGSTYDPELLRLEVTLYETFVQTMVETRTKVSWGVWGHCLVSGGYGFELVDRRDGKRGMKVVEKAAPTEKSWKEVEEGARVTKIILGIIAALAGIIIAVCTFGFGVAAAAPLYFAMYGGMIGFTALLGNEIFSGKTSPALDLLETRIDDTLMWCTGAAFTPSFIGLRHALQIGGATTGGARARGLQAGPSPAAAFQERYAQTMRARVGV